MHRTKAKKEKESRKVLLFFVLCSTPVRLACIHGYIEYTISHCAGVQASFSEVKRQRLWYRMASQIEHTLECKYQPAWRKEVASRKTVMVQIQGHDNGMTISDGVKVYIIKYFYTLADVFYTWYEDTVGMVYELDDYTFHRIAKFNEETTKHYEDFVGAMAMVPFLSGDPIIRVLNGKYRRGKVTLGEYANQVIIRLANIENAINRPDITGK